MFKMKKILSLLLAVLMCISMFTVVAFADEAEEVATDVVNDSAEISDETTTSQKVNPELFENSASQTVPESYTKVSENANLALFIDYATGEYALLNKKNSSYIFSNPLDREQDSVANSETKKIAEAQMSVSYITASFKNIDLTSGDANIITETYGDSQIISYFFDSDSTSFIIPVMLTLKEDYLEVELLIDSINEMSESRILSVSLMQVFGAGNPKDEGYILLPDGMGSLMKFNEYYHNVNVYDGYVYSKDPTSGAAVNEWNYGIDLTESIRMPVYGIKKNDSAYIAVMDQGAANVTLKAYCAGMLNSYNFIYPTINIRDSQTRRTGAGTTGAGVYYSDELPENFILRVYPLAGDDADYIGMAQKYREYLINDVGMKPLAEDAGTPMNVTLIGAYKKTKHFLGFPYTGVASMTTFEQAEDIVTDLTDNGVDNMICGMIGWNSGGLEDAVSTEFNPESKLGGKKGAEKLMATAKELDVPIQFDVDLINFFKPSGSYTKINSTVYGLDLSPVTLFPFIVSVNRVDKERTPHYLFHPTAMMDISTNFVKDASRFGVENFSFSTIGAEPYPAYNADDVYTRDRMTTSVTAILNNIDDVTDGIITSATGNAYVFPAVNNIVEAPIYSSKLYFAREEVPFYHTALRGLTRISGPALNLSAETDDVILRSAQFGVGLYTVLSYESSSNLKETTYNYYYSTEYALLGEDMANAYNRLKVVYDAIGTAAISDYEVVSDDLKITTFANGAKVYVNYGETDVAYNGVKIPAVDFVVVGGDK